MTAGPGSRGLLSTTHAARVALRAARWTECALLAASVFALILACAVISSGRAAQTEELALSALCALLAAATWWWPHRLGEHSVARRLDRRLEFDGAYLTAWEVESGRVHSTPLARALTARVLARVSSARAIRAALPHSAPWIAAPFVAAAVLALALDKVRSSHEGSAAVTATRSLASGLADLRSSAVREGTLFGDELAQLDELIEDARNLANEAASQPVRTDEAEADLARRVAALAQELERFAAQSPTDARLQRELEEGQILADEARLALGDQPESRLPDQNPGVADGSRVASGASPGTIPGSPDSSAGSVDAAVAPSAAPKNPVAPDDGAAIVAVGVFSRGRWWPARHDELVSSWIEARRALD